MANSLSGDPPHNSSEMKGRMHITVNTRKENGDRRSSHIYLPPGFLQVDVSIMRETADGFWKTWRIQLYA
jgi:hypothetical protein